MDLQLLRIFVAVYDTRSVSTAANMLEMRQSTVSNALARLRTLLNDPLFVRASRAMRPTPAAQRMAEPLRAALRALEEAIRIDERFDPLTARDELRVLTGDVVEMPIFGQLVPVIEKLAPQVVLRSVSRRVHEIESALETGEIDFAIGYFPELRSGNLFTTRIGSFTFGFFGRSGHPLAGRTLSMDEFSDARHIAVDADSSVTTVIERWLKARRIRRHVVVRTSHFHCIPDIVRMSDLIAVVPTNFRGAWLYGGQAARIMPPLKTCR